ncbi:MAG: acyl-CoA/acyl-ACP dehydrogenase [Alphaproteobacteria bacterium GM7ARS4]|nr:acyl-CoA/acyl-ACP dehydrogenase [Alphaproteobacteria bacterium GM7ARS4]
MLKPLSESAIAESPSLTPDTLLALCEESLRSVSNFTSHVGETLKADVLSDGKVDAQRFEQEQQRTHGYAWLMTTQKALECMGAWGQALHRHGWLTPCEQGTLSILFGEYLAQIQGGLPMNQQEFVRPHQLTEDKDALQQLHSTAITTLVRHAQDMSPHGPTAHVLASLCRQQWSNNGDVLSDDSDTYVMIREQFRRFSEDAVVPHVATWHDHDMLLPDSLIESMSALGVFSLATPEEYGGLGMKKRAMCIVTEELSRGFLAVGSLGTRSEIATELIRIGGTEQQKTHWLPKIADGSVLTCAVFTEPNTGSDLGRLTTRAVRQGDYYHLHGSKTWITHGARSDMMTVLARTDPKEKGYRGLSMFLAEKPRGDDGTPFPAKGMSGSEIRVLGYRGMKEYELSFDDYKVHKSQLLGETEGQGFKQLMATFESARIQTAARAVGVAQDAMETALTYGMERKQFGKALIEFPRIARKIAIMLAETQAARQLTYYAADEKDHDARCDIEAGMAKLLAARVAWANADNALQIHGGNGYALEYKISRVLCDARILNIFEGAAEIQAHVIARGLLTR